MQNSKCRTVVYIKESMTYMRCSSPKPVWSVSVAVQMGLFFSVQRTAEAATNDRHTKSSQYRLSAIVGRRSPAAFAINKDKSKCFSTTLAPFTVQQNRKEGGSIRCSSKSFTSLSLLIPMAHGGGRGEVLSIPATTHREVTTCVGVGAEPGWPFLFHLKVTTHKIRNENCS